VNVSNNQKINPIHKARVGKTSITVRFCKGEFDERQVSTLNAAFLE
jgi:GTPase SAR1 family protein